MRPREEVITKTCIEELKMPLVLSQLICRYASMFIAGNFVEMWKGGNAATEAPLKASKLAVSSQFVFLLHSGTSVIIRHTLDGFSQDLCDFNYIEVFRKSDSQRVSVIGNPYLEGTEDFHKFRGLSFGSIFVSALYATSESLMIGHGCDLYTFSLKEPLYDDTKSREKEPEEGKACFPYTRVQIFQTKLKGVQIPIKHQRAVPGEQILGVTSSPAGQIFALVRTLGTYRLMDTRDWDSNVGIRM
jgi:hypothetical protein